MQDSVCFENLSPLSFLDRSVYVYPDKTAVVDRGRTYTYSEFNARVNRQAAALQQIGVTKGDRVAVLAHNGRAMLEAKFGPMRLGAILVALNIRLSSREIAYILNHSGAKVLVFDSELAPTVRGLLDDAPQIESYIQVTDEAPKAEDIPGPDYEEFLAAAPAEPDPVEPLTETETITINYTSGTTGFPKGVEYHGRGAYLNDQLQAAGKRVHLAFCPERIVEGKALEEIPQLAQIVSGMTPEAVAGARQIFEKLGPEIVELTPAEAELSKLFANVWRYLKFSIANQFYMIANDFDLDFEKILLSIRHNYPRGQDLPQPGFAAVLQVHGRPSELTGARAAGSSLPEFQPHGPGSTKLLHLSAIHGRGDSCDSE